MGSLKRGNHELFALGGYGRPRGLRRHCSGACSADFDDPVTLKFVQSHLSCLSPDANSGFPCACHGPKSWPTTTIPWISVNRCLPTCAALLADYNASDIASPRWTWTSEDAWFGLLFLACLPTCRGRDCVRTCFCSKLLSGAMSTRTCSSTFDSSSTNSGADEVTRVAATKQKHSSKTIAMSDLSSESQENQRRGQDVALSP